MSLVGESCLLAAMNLDKNSNCLQGKEQGRAKHSKQQAGQTEKKKKDHKQTENIHHIYVHTYLDSNSEHRIPYPATLYVHTFLPIYLYYTLQYLLSSSSCNLCIADDGDSEQKIQHPTA